MTVGIVLYLKLPINATLKLKVNLQKKGDELRREQKKEVRNGAGVLHT